MKRATEKALKKMAGNGYPDVREALDEIERLRGLLREAVTNDLENEWYERVREALGDE
jgi:hypothetical protein